MAFELIHPDFCDSEGISPHIGGQILSVGFMSTLDVGDPCTRQDLHTAPTLPRLVLDKKKGQSIYVKSFQLPILYKLLLQMLEFFLSC